MIIKYQLENRTTPTGTGLTAPECISDGGYAFDIEDSTYTGHADSTQPLCASCVEITEVELEERKAKLANTRECAIRSDGQASYTESLDNDTNGFMVVKAYPSNTPVHYYTKGDSSCDFYSERPEGRKKYWTNNISPERYSQPDSDSQVLGCYSEVEGSSQEWYYHFIVFEDMMSFVNSHKSISLNSTLEVKMRDNPLSVRPTAFGDGPFMYIASVSITTAGDKTTTIYVTAQPEDVFS